MNYEPAATTPQQEDIIYKISKRHNDHLLQYAMSSPSVDARRTYLRHLLSLLLRNFEGNINDDDIFHQVELILSKTQHISSSEKVGGLHTDTCLHINLAAILFSLLEIELSWKVTLPILKEVISNKNIDQEMEYASCMLGYQLILARNSQFITPSSLDTEMIDSLGVKYMAVVSDDDHLKFELRILASAIKGDAIY